MSRIGNKGFTPLESPSFVTEDNVKRSFLTGFTLIEVMVATAVLALGIVLIFEAFFISLDSFNYCSNYLNVATWVDEKIWQAQDALSHLGSQGFIETEGSFVNRNKNFDWNLSYNLIDVQPDLYKINLVLSWKEGRRKVRVSRAAYAIYEKEE